MTTNKTKYTGDDRRTTERRHEERRTRIRFKDASGRRSGQDRRTAK